MPFGITNVTAPNLSTIMNIANQSDYPKMMMRVNSDIYNGYMFFALLWVLWIILYFAMNERNNQVLQNMMYSGFIVSLISLLLRVMEITESGVLKGLLTDKQMWMFPIITSLIALILWMTKKEGSG